MRILHLIPSLETGGAERQLSYLAPEMARRGAEVHVASLRGGSNLGRMALGGVRLHRLSASGNHDPLLLPRTVSLIRRVRPDLVQSWLLQMDILAGVAAWICGVRWAIAERSSEVGYPPTAKNRIRRFLGGRADLVVANSAGGERYWRGAPSPGRLVVIPNGVPLSEIDGAAPAPPDPEGPGEGAPSLLCAGRLSAEKNLVNLLRGAAGPLEAYRGELVVCGDGPLRDSLRDEAARLGVAGRVRMPGEVPDLWPRMKRSRGLLSLSRFEGCPNVVQEAMACRCPLVVSDIPAHREILDERSALFADPDRPESIGDAVRRLLDSPAEAGARAENARKRIEALDVAAMTVRYLSAYGRLLGAEGKGEEGR